MRYSEARTGRVFVIRLETGDRLPDVIERFAADQDVAGVHETAGVWVLAARAVAEA